MNTKLIMIASSLVMGGLGIIASFFPDEILRSFEQTPTDILRLFVQITGALYLGFAIMNWMAKTVLIGGIYARPLCVGNFSHFLVAGLSIMRVGIQNPMVKLVWLLAIIYLIFAFLFSFLLFTSPKTGRCDR
ncbi:hypothetical protein [Albibacterium indicum]|uniref:hypothetical protein n=1 Tax=Albibacterium indicum TaxID=2292082 RepID=UPI000E4A11E6|nr:hypothetical protein [Pedobacter indicus]